MSRSNWANAPTMWKNSLPRAGGVAVLVDHERVDAALLQVAGEFDEVLQGPAEPVKLGDDQRVTLTQELKCRIELGPFGEFAADAFVDEDFDAAGLGEHAVLCVRVLVPLADPAVSDLRHPVSVS
jgi:hypothetical protein